MGRKGNITIILLGLISVMIIFMFSLSRRMSGHTQLLTVADSSQIARYFLESYSGDVFRQLKKLVNDSPANTSPSEYFKCFRDVNVAERCINFSEYKACSLLVNLEKDLEIKRIGTPKLKIADMKPLKTPSMFEYSSQQKNREKRGFIEIDCVAEFQKKKYNLNVRYPFRVVFTMTPMLREFVLFVDKMHLEQTTAFLPEDKVNILQVTDGECLENSSSGRGNPLILMSEPPDDQKVERNGRVYLGDDSHGIYMNLAGEKNFRSGRFNDLWQITPRTFDPTAPSSQNFSCIHFFDKKDGSKLTLRGMHIELAKRGHLARMAVLGFSSEVDDTNKGIFAEASWKLDDFTKTDPAFEKIKGNRQLLSMASAVKLRGLNMEPELDRLGGASALKTYYGPAREIYGNVFARFFVLTFFEFPSGFGPLPFNSDPNYRPSYNQPITNQPMYFEPKSGNYASYMSRVVSGGDGAYNSTGARNTPLNQIGGPLPGVPTLLPYSSFKPFDLLKVKKPFDNFAGEWFKLEKNKPGDSLRSVQSRICRYFPDQKSFEENTGIAKGKFHLNGVVFLDSPLSLTNDINTKDIKGGIVLVNGPITLGNITRGLTGFKSDSEFKDLMKLRDDMKQEEVLTFVSITGDTITLAGDKHIGVHLVSFKPGITSPVDQIRWTKGDEIVFLGGIAVNVLNLKERVRDFKKSPLFYYLPCMSSADPSLSVSLLGNMSSYRMKLAN
ncbi:MAG: hypothetical protein HQM10_14030 [Candidatus Riflebacteria bacterium]|nr:hypothetical protein [Candidatus Riflebacteria bacterium]